MSTKFKCYESKTATIANNTSKFKELLAYVNKDNAVCLGTCKSATVSVGGTMKFIKNEPIDYDDMLLVEINKQYSIKNEKTPITETEATILSHHSHVQKKTAAPGQSSTQHYQQTAIQGNTHSFTHFSHDSNFSESSYVFTPKELIVKTGKQHIYQEIPITLPLLTNELIMRASSTPSSSPQLQQYIRVIRDGRLYDEHLPSGRPSPSPPPLYYAQRIQDDTPGSTPLSPISKRLYRRSMAEKILRSSCTPPPPVLPLFPTTSREAQQQRHQELVEINSSEDKFLSSNDNSLLKSPASCISLQTQKLVTAPSRHSNIISSSHHCQPQQNSLNQQNLNQYNHRNEKDHQYQQACPSSQQQSYATQSEPSISNKPHIFQASVVCSNKTSSAVSIADSHTDMLPPPPPAPKVKNSSSGLTATRVSESVESHGTFDEPSNSIPDLGKFVSTFLG